MDAVMQIHFTDNVYAVALGIVLVRYFENCYSPGRVCTTS